MAMDRNEVIETLASLAGPLGPFTTLEERLSQEDRWAESGGSDLLEALADIAPSLGPSDKWGPASLDDVQTLLSRSSLSWPSSSPNERCRGSCRYSRMAPLAESQSMSSQDCVMSAPFGR